MLAKIMTGKDFGRCAKYILGKGGATILDADGVRTENLKFIIQDFNMQRKANPNLGVAVGHIVLSWRPSDISKLTPERMMAHAKEYLDKMSITGTQYLIVQHCDRPNPHVHIIYNRVNYKAKTLKDQSLLQKNFRIIKELNLKYGYRVAFGKNEVNAGRLKGPDKVKYELFQAIKKAAKDSLSWNQLIGILMKDNIEVRFKRQDEGEEILGVSFRKDNISFKGSKVDRSLSYQNLTRQLMYNESLVLGNREIMDMSKSMDQSQNLSSVSSAGNSQELLEDAAGAVSAKSAALKEIDEDVPTITPDSHSIENDAAWAKSHDKINSEETINEIPYKRKR